MKPNGVSSLSHLWLEVYSLALHSDSRSNKPESIRNDFADSRSSLAKPVLVRRSIDNDVLMLESE